jgi:MFS family permease
MLRALIPVTALLVSVSALLMGNGLLGVLIPLRAHLEAMSALAIGLIGSAYFMGLTLGCFAGPFVVKRVGHIRAFTALAALAAVTALLHALIVAPAAWFILRLATGLCLAGLTMIIESWLNERSTNETRGRVLAVYTMLNLSVVTVGQQLVNLAETAGFALFSAVSILMSLAVVPVALSTATAPPPIHKTRLRLALLFRTSPVAAAGSFGVGLANGAFWALGPLYALARGLELSGVAIFMSMAVLGGALLQWPLGWLSDRTDRRRIVLGLAFGASAVGLPLALLPGLPAAWLWSLAGLYGCFAIPIYAISTAHANDHARGQDAVEVSGGLLLLYSIGASCGPTLAAFVLGLVGHVYLFVYTAAVHLLLAGFTLYRIGRRAPPPVRESFVSVPRTAPTVFMLDPRAAYDEDEPAEAAETGT